MSRESHQHSIPLTNPVDPSVVRVLRLLDPIARSVDCEYFVAGATARDLILVTFMDYGRDAPHAISTLELRSKLGAI